MLASRTPLRVSFFGGGTDFKDYYSLDHGCVLSTAVDKYVYIMVNRKFDAKIQLKYSLTEIVDAPEQIFHPTLRESIRYVGLEGGLELAAMADFPSFGTGLGSSSSFLVGTLNALHNLRGDAPDAERLAREACEIEIGVLREPIGKQDQYIAAYGGFNFITFNRDDSVSVQPVIVKRETLDALQKKLLFFYTGISRSSSSVLREQKQGIGDKVAYLDEIRSICVKAKGELERGRFESFGELLAQSWELKRSLASGVSNDAINNFYSRAMEAGAAGGKILGAGGGGFFMFYCDEERQDAVRKALQPMREVTFGFPAEGSRIIFREGADS